MNLRRRLTMLPSASKSDLADHCVFPWNGGVRWPKWEPMRTDQRFGKAFHAAAEAAAHVFEEFGTIPGSLELGVFWCAEAFELTENERQTLEALMFRLVEQLENDDAEWRVPEFIFAVNVESGDVRRLANRQDKRPSERVAIADLVFKQRNGSIVVREYKTGRGAQSKRAETSGQTRLLAFATARHFELADVRCEVVHVAVDGFIVDAAQFDSLALCVIECEQEALVERLLAAPKPNPGPWCTGEFCSIIADCPATKAMLAEVERHALSVPVLHEPQSAEEAGRLRTAVHVVRKWADAAEERWQSWAKRMPIPVGGGKVVIVQERKGDEELVENDKMLDIVIDEIAQMVFDQDATRIKEAQRAAVVVKASKASIERGVRKALGPAPVRGALKRGQTRIVERLRSQGLVRHGAHYVVYTEVPADRIGSGAIDTEGAEAPE